MKKTVFLFGHRARVGKDTLAQTLAEKHGVVRFAFADKLKSVVADLYGFNQEQMYGTLKDVEDLRFPNSRDSEILDEITFYEKGEHPSSHMAVIDLSDRKNPDYKPFLTPRRILQHFGQDQRSLFADIWAAYVTRQIEKETNQFFCVTDFRFPNEYEVVRKWAESTDNTVVTVKITRPDMPEISGANDISETALNNFPKWDYIIDNSGSIEALYNKFMEFGLLV